MMNDDDPEITHLLMTDLQHAFWHLVHRYQHQLWAFALRLTGHRQDAEDIVQDALLGAYITLSRYPRERIETLRLRPWLYKIALNAFRNRKRDQRIQWHSLEMVEGATGEEFAWEQADEEQPEQLIERSEDRLELEAVLMQLPMHYRIVVTCYFFEELTYQEIAVLIDQPLGTVKSRLHRGLRLARQYVQVTQQERRSHHGV